MRRLLKLVEIAKKEGAKSIFLFENMPAYFKGAGLIKANDFIFGKKDLEEFMRETLSEWKFENFKKEREVDYSVEFDSLARFRINGFLRNGSLGLVLRPIPDEVPEFDELNLPSILKDFVKYDRGLFLVTGPTGSGKSTTVASLIELINRERACHIITIEDPIEFVFKPKRSIISQREIGKDTKSFWTALKRVLREDPDVIFVGEIRDKETMKVVLELAETGHLVLSTLHTRDSIQTINRIIDFFPEEERKSILSILAEVLIGVCCQKLIPRIDKKGFVCATEILKMTQAVKNVIREGKIHQIPLLLESQKKEGMISFDASILELAKKGLISIPEAIDVAKEERVFIEKIKEIRPKKGISYLKKGTLEIEKENILYELDTSPIEYIDSSGIVIYTPLGLFFREGAFGKKSENHFIVDYSIIQGKKDSFPLGAFFSLEYLIRDLKAFKKGFVFYVSVALSSSEEVFFPKPPFFLLFDKEWQTLTVKIPENLRGKMVRVVALIFDKDIREIFFRNIRFF